MRLITLGHKHTKDSLLQRFLFVVKLSLLSIIEILDRILLQNLYRYKMLLCDSFYSNNNKKISFHILLKMKSGVFVKLSKNSARNSRLKLEHLNEIITFHYRTNLISYRLDVRRIREEKGGAMRGDESPLMAASVSSTVICCRSTYEISNPNPCHHHHLHHGRG